MRMRERSAPLDKSCSFLQDRILTSPSGLWGKWCSVILPGPRFCPVPMAAQIQNHSEVQLAVGDIVEATGFAQAGPFNPVMVDAALWKTGHATLAEPPLVTAEE